MAPQLVQGFQERGRVEHGQRKKKQTLKTSNQLFKNEEIKKKK